MFLSVSVKPVTCEKKEELISGLLNFYNTVVKGRK